MLSRRDSLPDGLSQGRRSVDGLITLLGSQGEPGSAFPDILHAAVDAGHAEAGSIYIEEGGEYWFAWSENRAHVDWNGLYPGLKVRISRESLAGYTAFNNEELRINDTSADLSAFGCTFDASFDKKTGFVTRNSLTLPLRGDMGRAGGVLQVINFEDPDMRALKEITAFAANEVFRVRRIRNDTVRILRMAALRDPLETAEHVKRVAEIAVILRTEWGARHGEGQRAIARARNTLYYSAMLHDVGKVGIADEILKKPGRLTPEERQVMEEHSRLGWELFRDGSNTDIDRESRDVILHHHQRWDGKGYPRNDQLSGENIPFAARIVSIADVWDALVSRRCYKEPMPVPEARGIIAKEAGRAFDPQLSLLFLELQKEGRI